MRSLTFLLAVSLIPLAGCMSEPQMPTNPFCFDHQVNWTQEGVYLTATERRDPPGWVVKRWPAGNGAPIADPYYTNRWGPTVLHSIEWHGEEWPAPRADPNWVPHVFFRDGKTLFKAVIPNNFSLEEATPFLVSFIENVTDVDQTAARTVVERGLERMSSQGYGLGDGAQWDGRGLEVEFDGGFRGQPFLDHIRAVSPKANQTRDEKEARGPWALGFGTETLVAVRSRANDFAEIRIEGNGGNTINHGGPRILAPDEIRAFAHEALSEWGLEEYLPAGQKYGGHGETIYDCIDENGHRPTSTHTPRY